MQTPETLKPRWRKKRWAANVLLCLGLLGAAVWAGGSNKHVPTAEQVQDRAAFRPFLVEPSGVKGVYGNLDVDAAVFNYRTGVGGMSSGDGSSERFAGQTGSPWLRKASSDAISG